MQEIRNAKLKKIAKKGNLQNGVLWSSSIFLKSFIWVTCAQVRRVEYWNIDSLCAHFYR